MQKKIPTNHAPRLASNGRIEQAVFTLPSEQEIVTGRSNPHDHKCGEVRKKCCTKDHYWALTGREFRILNFRLVCHQCTADMKHTITKQANVKRIQLQWTWIGLHESLGGAVIRRGWGGVGHDDHRQLWIFSIKPPDAICNGFFTNAFQ